MTRIAVIGAGLAGLVVARHLSRRYKLAVFEKSRGCGGRMATRYVDDYEFDHGAQFFTARSPAFRRFLQPLLDAGIVANWQARFAELDRNRIVSTRQWDDEFPHYVGTPRMNALGKFLAAGLDVRLETPVTGIRPSHSGWRLHGAEDAELGEFEWVIVAVPAAQSRALLGDAAVDIVQPGWPGMSGCFALMLGFGEALDLPWQAAVVRNADISWVSVNSSKPGRGGAYTLLAHSSNAWADDNIDMEPAAVIQHMLAELAAVIGEDIDGAELQQLQRWRFANIDKQNGPFFALDHERKLAVCGDWFIRGRVEAAFTSGNRLARALDAIL